MLIKRPKQTANYLDSSFCEMETSGFPVSSRGERGR